MRLRWVVCAFCGVWTARAGRPEVTGREALFKKIKSRWWEDQSPASLLFLPGPSHNTQSYPSHVVGSKSD